MGLIYDFPNLSKVCKKRRENIPVLLPAYAYRLGLTTLAADREQKTDALIELLIRRIREPDAPLQQIAIPLNLIIRETG